METWAAATAPHHRHRRQEGQGEASKEGAAAGLVWCGRAPARWHGLPFPDVSAAGVPPASALCGEARHHAPGPAVHIQLYREKVRTGTLSFMHCTKDA